MGGRSRFAMLSRSFPAILCPAGIVLWLLASLS
nr:MAG TPA: hypothetical protein [Caudoviricetes sp.]